MKITRVRHGDNGMNNLRTELDALLERIAKRNQNDVGLAEDCLRMMPDLAAKLKQARQWVSDLQSGMYVNCVYCGHRYGPDPVTPVAMAEVLKKHIQECPEHPMSKMRTQLLRNRQGCVNILEMRKLNGCGERYGALTRQEIEAVIVDIDAALV